MLLCQAAQDETLQTGTEAGREGSVAEQKPQLSSHFADSGFFSLNSYRKAVSAIDLSGDAVTTRPSSVSLDKGARSQGDQLSWGMGD